MKTASFILIIIFIFSCRNSNFDLMDKHHTEVHEKMELISIELDKFDKTILRLYDEAATNPNSVIQETDELINKIKTENDPNNVKWNKLMAIYSLRAEVFYKTKQYRYSINEVKNSQQNNKTEVGSNTLSQNDYIILACNYLKLKEFDKTKNYIDSVGKGYYLHNYILGNYFEAIGNKTEALKNYNIIKQDKTVKDYPHYDSAIRRIQELEKDHPKLLEGIDYPIENPGFQIYGLGD